MFDVKNKIALITGGSQGIGINYAKALLKHGVKGVTIADINPTKGKLAVEELTKLYGTDRVQFVLTDVTDIKQFENAFKATVDRFKNVDILINNAGVINESNWKQVVEVNFIGTINGILLGLENYLKNYKSGNEGVILCTSSNGAMTAPPHCPIYVGTKAAVNGLVLSWGHPSHYERTNVRVLSLCPGATKTDIFTLDSKSHFLTPDYGKIYDGLKFNFQEPEVVAEEAVKIIQNAANGTVWIVNEGKTTQYSY